VLGLVGTSAETRLTWLGLVFFVSLLYFLGTVELQVQVPHVDLDDAVGGGSGRTIVDKGCQGSDPWFVKEIDSNLTVVKPTTDKNQCCARLGALSLAQLLFWWNDIRWSKTNVTPELHVLLRQSSTSIQSSDYVLVRWCNQTKPDSDYHRQDRLSSQSKCRGLDQAQWKKTKPTEWSYRLRRRFFNVERPNTPSEAAELNICTLGRTGMVVVVALTWLVVGLDDRLSWWFLLLFRFAWSSSGLNKISKAGRRGSRFKGTGVVVKRLVIAETPTPSTSASVEAASVVKIMTGAWFACSTFYKNCFRCTSLCSSTDAKVFNHTISRW
jgi:hypothetical protein